MPEKEVLLLMTFAFLLCISLNRCDSGASSCEFGFYPGQESHPVIISDLFSYYPLEYGKRTYIDSIDNLFVENKFSQTNPRHQFDFASCLEAKSQAKKDFIAGKPSLIQFNGIVGEMPYKNEIYSEIIGLHIENTGCYLYSFSECYNEEIWNLIDARYGEDVKRILSRLDSIGDNLVVDVDEKKAVIANRMPTIRCLELGEALLDGNDSLKCKYESMLLGRFNLEVQKNGRAKVLNYLGGSLNCECVGKMTSYFETIEWVPAMRDSEEINSIVEIQFIDF